MIVRKHFVRDLMYLYTSVFSAGMRNIVSQMFFDSYYPANKEALVSLSLFFNAVYTMLGIMASSQLLRSEKWNSRRKKTVMTAVMTAAVCISFASMFLVRTFLSYTVMFCISGFSLNFLYNVFDVFISGTVEPVERERNVRVLLTYQMAGYIIGPLLFSLFADSAWLCVGIAVGMLFICFLPVSREYIKADKAAHPVSDLSNSGRKARIKSLFSRCNGDNIVMFYSFMMYCATNTLMPSVAYIMKDHLHAENYAVKSSIFLAGTVLVSAAVIALLPAMKLWKLRNAAPLSIAAALAMIIILRSDNVFLLAAAAILSGAGNGIFLSGSRFYVNAAAPERGLVQRYNRVITGATLIGYMVAALISWLCVKNGITVVPAKLTAIIIMLVLALVFGCFRVRHEEKE